MGTLTLTGGDGGESNYTANTVTQVLTIIWSLV